MKKPTSGSKWAALKRTYWLNHRGRRRPVYLYVFPASREGGWLCDGNDTRGKEINRRAENKTALAQVPNTGAYAHLGERGGGSYYLSWTPISANLREAKAEALEDAARALDRLGSEGLTSDWLRHRAGKIRHTR